jgi:hypothetical protein
MKPFWRDEELTEKEKALLDACLTAHAQSVNRANISSIVIKEAARGSGDYTKALGAGLLTMGWIHAPLMATWGVLNGKVMVKEVLDAGGKVPGWGSSFENSEWHPVIDLLRSEFPVVWGVIENVTMQINAAGKPVDPNPSCYTAAVGIALGMPPIVLPWLFIQGRLASWTMLFMNTVVKEEH